MKKTQKNFINRPTCAIILSVLACVFVLVAFIVSRTTMLIDFNIKTVEEVPTYTASINWNLSSIYLAFMLTAALIMCAKWFSCTLRHYKLEPTNKLLMANLVIELLALLITVVAAFAIFMFSKEGQISDDEIQNILLNLIKPYTILSSISLGLTFFGSITNLITLAKEK